MNTDPILIVDDDIDDVEFIQDAWKELNYQNELIFFKNGEQVLHYLETEKTMPFLIISEVSLPTMDGFELKEKLLKQDSMRYKSIPFVFWSSKISNSKTQKAYDLGVNGIFVKESNLEELKQSLIDIVEYWMKSKVPE